jgi:hypothetical protein
MNKKFCQNIVKWDLVSKFLLSEIQWCDRNLILMFDLWFIDFFSFNQCCMWMMLSLLFSLACMHSKSSYNTLSKTSWLAKINKIEIKMCSNRLFKTTPRYPNSVSIRTHWLYSRAALLAIFSALAHIGSTTGRRGTTRAKLLLPRSSAEPSGAWPTESSAGCRRGVGAKDLVVEEDGEELPVAEGGEELADRDVEVRRDARVRREPRRRPLGSAVGWASGGPR